MRKSFIEGVFELMIGTALLGIAMSINFHAVPLDYQLMDSLAVAIGTVLCALGLGDLLTYWRHLICPEKGGKIWQQKQKRKRNYI